MNNKNTEIPNFVVWYQNSNNQYRLYNYQTCEYTLSNDLPSKQINSFYLPSKYQLLKRDIEKENISIETYYIMLDNNMKEYSHKLVIDRDELMNYKKLKIQFDYFDNSFIKTDGLAYYRTHSSNVRVFMNKLLKDENNVYKYASYDDVTLDEYNFFVKCNNGGLTYLKDKGKYYDTHGYDFQMSYPADLASIGWHMPQTIGKFHTLKTLREARYLQYGIYHVNIECENVNFLKIFKLNKNHYYTHYSLKFAIQKMKKYDVVVKLIIDDKPNALLYDKLICGKDLFGNWYNRLKDMKNDLKNNSIVKFLSSTAWGHLSELQTQYFNEDKINEMVMNGKIFSNDFNDKVDYIIKDMKEIDEITRYEVFETNTSVYKLPFRILPFITSFSRIKMATMIEQYALHDKLIRIQTDGMTLSEEFKDYSKVRNLKYDEKISGNIEFVNLNNYHKFE